MHLKYMYFAARTRNVENAGSDNQPNLVIYGIQRQIPFTNEHRSRGQAGFARVDISDLELLPEEIDYVVSAGGNDFWKLDHATVWGERATSGHIVPLGFGSVQGLSQEEEGSGGSATTIFPPLVTLGSENMMIRRLLLVIHTVPLVNYPLPPNIAPVLENGTESTVNLQIGTNTGLVVDYDFPQTPQSDLQRSHANYYLAPVSSPFRRSNLSDQSITLSIRGHDRWDPLIVAIFGIDSTQGEAQSLIPLVHIPLWPFNSMSTDPEEGSASIHLPLAPIDDLTDNPSGLPSTRGGLVVARRLQKRIRELEMRLNELEINS